MSFLGVELINPCIEKTKRFLFPINKKLWLKLGLVSLLTGTSSSNFNFNVPSSFDTSSMQSILNYIPLMIILFGVLIVFGLLFAFISTWFNFVLIDSVEKKRCLIKTSLSENISKAVSYFFFALMVSLPFFAAMILLAVPIIVRLVKGMPILTYPYFWIMLLLAVLLVIVWSFVKGILFHLVMPDVYYNKLSVFDSCKRMCRLLFKEIKEVLMYGIMSLVLSIAAGIIGLFAVLIGLVVFGIIGLVLFGIGTLIAMAIPALTIPLIIVGVILAILLFLFAIYALVVVLVPLPVFFTNYRLDFYKGLVKKNKKMLKA